MHGAAGFNPEFLRGESWGFPGLSVEHIETHAAHVFLCGDRAFKIKKAVQLPYLDFSTVDIRRAVLARELEINRTFAPALYLDIIEKEGEPVLVMKRFADTAMLSWQVSHGGVSDKLAADLARMIAEAHWLTPRAEVAGSGIMAGLGQQLAEAFHQSPDIFPIASACEFDTLYQYELSRLSGVLDLRSSRGLVRRCHGDMHCANIVVLEGRPVLFDAIEFSEKIATIDVLYDVAFLIMDLLRHRQKRAANIVFNRYLHLRRAEEDLSGLEALPLFLAARAGVRALVTADLAHELDPATTVFERGTASSYFNASLAFLKPVSPQLICVGGLSGTGKSTLAAGLAPRTGAPPGAIHIRSDVERKVLAGIDEAEHLAPEFYSSTNAGHVYEAVLTRARRALLAGQAVIIDAVFAREGERVAAENLACSMGVAFRGLWLEADAATMKARVTSRTGDASDATSEVIDTQLKYDLGNIIWLHIDADGSPEQVLARVPAD